MTPTQTTARAILAARYFRDLSRPRVATELERITGRHWTADMVARTEVGTRPVDVETLQALAEVFDVPLEFLLYGPTLVGASRRAGERVIEPLPTTADTQDLHETSAAA